MLPGYKARGKQETKYLKSSEQVGKFAAHSEIRDDRGSAQLNDNVVNKWGLNVFMDNKKGAKSPFFNSLFQLKVLQFDA
ncbi:MAG: hypothetical protein Salg2KO_04010 [Salibacteraceae bacterium]